MDLTDTERHYLRRIEREVLHASTRYGSCNSVRVARSLETKGLVRLTVYGPGDWSASLTATGKKVAATL